MEAPMLGSVTQKLGATITINDNGGDGCEDDDAHADADTHADAVVWFSYAQPSEIKSTTLGWTPTSFQHRSHLHCSHLQYR